MRNEGIAEIEKQGFFVLDSDGDNTTPLVNNNECAFVVFDENKTAKCTIDVLESGRLFGWCTGDVSTPGARWRYELYDLGGTIRVRNRVILGPGESGLTRIIAENPQNEAKIIRNRLSALRHNMQMVLDGMKASLED